MVNNPLMFTYLTGYPSVVLPNERPDVLLDAAGATARLHRADAGRPRRWRAVRGTQSAPGLILLFEFAGADGSPVRVFIVEGS
jgi:hypothetical protein